MILSNKAILPVLWELFPRHPYLLPAYFSNDPLSSYVSDQCICRTDGEYGEEGFIYQQLFQLPEFDGNYALVGSWVIGQQPAGIGIRESGSLITDNLSRFVPHATYLL